MTFAEETRRLDAAATPAEKWSLFNDRGVSVTNRGTQVANFVHPPDAALVVHLRNHAEQIAALVEAAKRFTVEMDRTPLAALDLSLVPNIEALSEAACDLNDALAALEPPGGDRG